MNLKGRNFLTLKDLHRRRSHILLIYPQNLKQRRKPASFTNITEAKILHLFLKKQVQEPAALLR